MMLVEVCRRTGCVQVMLKFGLDELQNKSLETLKPGRKGYSEVGADRKLDGGDW